MLQFFYLRKFYFWNGSKYSSLIALENNVLKVWPSEIICPSMLGINATNACPRFIHDVCVGIVTSLSGKPTAVSELAWLDENLIETEYREGWGKVVRSVGEWIVTLFHKHLLPSLQKPTLETEALSLIYSGT